MNTRLRYEIVPIDKESAFVYREFLYESFDVDLHSHDEVEITLIEHGVGKKIIGNEISWFEPMDLVLIDSNIPHLYLGEDSYMMNHEDYHCHVIQINPHFFESNFFDFNESKHLKELVNSNKFSGIQFSVETSKKVFPILKQLKRASGINGILILLEILSHLSDGIDNIQIGTKKNIYHNEQEQNRAKNVYNHILQNYMRDLSLEKTAEIAGMSKTAFCNYFKKRTDKRFSEFVNELRIQKACVLLVETDETISRISFAIGFNNLSYFNREFRKKIGCSPYEYRMTKKHHQQ